jgi:hypothetical protein
MFGMSGKNGPRHTVSMTVPMSATTVHADLLAIAVAAAKKKHNTDKQEQKRAQARLQRYGRRLGTLLNVLGPKEIEFLHRAYKPERWYWVSLICDVAGFLCHHPLHLSHVFTHSAAVCPYQEILETTRRLTLTAVLSVVDTGSNQQILFGLLVQLMYMKLYSSFNPYIEVQDAMLQEMCQYQVFLLLLAALLIRNNALYGGLWGQALDGIVAIVVLSSLSCALYFIVDILVVRKPVDYDAIKAKLSSISGRVDDDRKGVDNDDDSDDDEDSSDDDEDSSDDDEGDRPVINGSKGRSSVDWTKSSQRPLEKNESSGVSQDEVPTLAPFPGLLDVVGDFEPVYTPRDVDEGAGGEHTPPLTSPGLPHLRLRGAQKGVEEAEAAAAAVAAAVAEPAPAPAAAAAAVPEPEPAAAAEPAELAEPAAVAAAAVEPAAPAAEEKQEEKLEDKLDEEKQEEKLEDKLDEEKQEEKQEEKEVEVEPAPASASAPVVAKPTPKRIPEESPLRSRGEQARKRIDFLSPFLNRVGSTPAAAALSGSMASAFLRRARPTLPGHADDDDDDDTAGTPAPSSSPSDTVAAAGFPSAAFTVPGALPDDGPERQAALQGVATAAHPVVLHEAP